MPSGNEAQTHRETRSAQTADTLSEQLISTSKAALELSRRVHASLCAGAAPSGLVPLLRREAAMAHELRAGIKQLAAAVDMPPSNHRAELRAQLKALLNMEERNHRLLSRRGITLNTPVQR